MTIYMYIQYEFTSFTESYYIFLENVLVQLWISGSGVVACVCFEVDKFFGMSLQNGCMRIRQEMICVRINAG